MNDKPRWTQITDPAEAAALVQAGKYREEKPTWIRRADSVWVLVNDVWLSWREHFGKRL